MTEPSKEVAKTGNTGITARFDREALQSWSGDVTTDTRPILKTAMIVLIALFGFGGVWAAVAPLGGAVIASGKVIAAGQNRLVQHLEGGILKTLAVREGDTVDKGDVLVELETINADAELEANRLQKALARIELARLRAEVSEQTSVEFPSDIDPAVADSERVREAMQSQYDEFHFGLQFRQSSRSKLDNQILGRKGDITGNEEVIVAMERQLELYELELTDFKVLLEQGHISRTRVFATERQVVDLIARIANIRLEIEKARNEIVNMETEKRQNRSDFLAKANAKLLDTQKQFNEASANVIRLSDMLERMVVRAPVDGTVFRIAKRTIGEVVGPGDTIMILFPENDALTIEANLQPTDRDEVFVGQDVMVVFPSDRKNQQAPVPGKLIYVSADTITTEEDPIGSYTVNVQVEPDASPEQLLPGNLADVFIQTESKTFLQIISEPFTRFAFRAFKG